MIAGTKGRRGQHGQALILFALTMTVLIGFAALAVEIGQQQGDRRLLQAVSDGAALAGAEFLDVDSTLAQPQSARQTAAKFAFNGLANGDHSGGYPACDFSQDINVPAGTNTCNPDSNHTLTIQTPYNGRSDSILVRVDDVEPLQLATAIGVTSTHTASRAVAHKNSGGAPFGFALYVAGNLTSHGNVDLQVGGNIFVGGCIELTNADSVLAFSQNGQPGYIQVYNDSTIVGSVQKQVWNSGAGVGCNGSIVSRDSWGASGNTVDGTGGQSCGQTDAAANFFAPCPSGTPPLQFVGPPASFNVNDPCAVSGATPGPFSAAQGGCYNPCVGGGNLTIPNNTTLAPGAYSFKGNGTQNGCDVILGGNLSNTTSGGDGNGGVTIFLDNGTGICVSPNCTSSGSGTLAINAPTSGQNRGILMYACGGANCQSGAGQIFLKGPSLTLQLSGMIYGPGSACTLDANGAQQTTGQILCNSLDIQGGASSSAEQLYYGGAQLPNPIFDVKLDE